MVILGLMAVIELIGQVLGIFRKPQLASGDGFVDLPHVDGHDIGIVMGVVRDVCGAICVNIDTQIIRAKKRLVPIN